MKISEINITTKGNINPNLLSLKKAPPKRAIAVTGVTFGGWGRSLISIATNIIPNIINCLLLKIDIISIYFSQKLNYLL